MKSARHFIRSMLPDYWFQQHSYSKAWDTQLLEALEKYTFEPISGYVVKLGPYELWVANHPYASFSKRYGHTRPKRSTIAYAKEKLDEADIPF